MSFAKSAVFYQIYPIGALGAERVNDFSSIPADRLSRLKDWLPHLVKLDVNAIYLCPLFESSEHGYDTADFLTVDRRLGSNKDLTDFVSECHKNNIYVVLDGVFNHVGRDFWAFRDVKANRERSPYAGWFFTNFSGNSNYNDGFWYDGWEGHYELVKLNLHNKQVRDYLLNVVGTWIKEFDIDGLRLDVAYSLTGEFLQELSSFCRNAKNDFWLMGEALHGDYRVFMDGGKLDSVTNYECYKGLYSSFNSRNMFEIAYSINRQFGAEQWTLYKGRHLFNFVDNHDVSRVATILSNKRHLPLIYTLLFTMPGIPCIYYGSEWGMEGDKKNGDNGLRPQIDSPMFNELSSYISALADIHKQNKALNMGSYKELKVTNNQYIFERAFEGKRTIVAINIDENDYVAHFNANAGCGIDKLTNNKIDFGGGLKLKAMSAMIIDDLQ